ncbi:DUF3999 domain-containing protein [Pseudoxanthomonas sp.]|uniref:DUF3999 domain-containing protein n=1 Tax=Pseudoxanthomonas sp. TaxID=1871049 RepID=UPI002635E18F|nr:DUF3999 domain-containing protein [Pseudoxanthomonas sp.]WDS37525.1 MAG: DUF3999 domain-containing protein [Pseudoxanthomonas sp.]
MKAMFLMLLVPLAAAAAGSGDNYVQQWPMQLSTADAGAYRVTLSDAVYRTAQSPVLADVVPRNAQGQPLPAALMAADSPLAMPPQRVGLPLFQLPARPAGQSGDLQLIAQRDAQGAVTRVETRLPEGATQAARAGGWLLDASALKSPVQAVWLEWQAQPQLQAELRLEGSDDLRDWFLIDPRVTVVDLDNGRQRLSQRRIALPSSAHYLRIVPVSGSVPVLQSVQAEVAAPVAAQPWQSVLLDGKALERGFEFTSPGRFPVAQVDVVSGGNEAVEWIVQSRDASDAPWVQRAGPWLAYQVGGAAQRSAPQRLSVTTRDRYWRLLPSAGKAATAPQLRLDYRPEVIVFLAQGTPLYALAAGSANARRSDAPLQPMIAALRQDRGAQWQPALAELAATAQPLQGEAALQPVAEKPDWKKLLLWALLVIGALVVGGFAVSLLRAKQPPDGPST